MIRRATEHDAEEVARIINAAFEVEREFRQGDRTSPSEVRELMRREIFLVAEEGSSLIGTVEVRVQAATGYFGMLAVDATARHSGVGRTLVQAAEDECRSAGCTLMTLSTGENRQELMPYYRKMGYRLVDVRTTSSAAFKRPIRVVTMEKAL